MAVDTSLSAFLRGKTTNLSAKLTAKINSEKAPAFEKGVIQLSATAEKNGNILSSSTTYKLLIKPDFVPLLEASISNSSINLTTGEETNVSIVVKNRANMKISANITSNVTNSEHLEVFLPAETSIDIDGEVSFPLRIKAIESEDYINVIETVTFTVSYHAYKDETLVGESLDVMLTTHIKSEETPLKIADFLPLFIAIIVIVIVLITLVFFIKRRR